MLGFYWSARCNIWIWTFLSTLMWLLQRHWFLRPQESMQSLFLKHLKLIGYKRVFSSFNLTRVAGQGMWGQQLLCDCLLSVLLCFLDDVKICSSDVKPPTGGQVTQTDSWRWTILRLGVIKMVTGANILRLSRRWWIIDEKYTSNIKYTTHLTIIDLTKWDVDPS